VSPVSISARLAQTLPSVLARLHFGPGRAPELGLVSHWLRLRAARWTKLIARRQSPDS
jgi:hypothetical protein